MEVSERDELHILLDGLCKALMERITPGNGKADALDVQRAERILALVKELAE